MRKLNSFPALSASFLAVSGVVLLAGPRVADAQCVATGTTMNCVEGQAGAPVDPLYTTPAVITLNLTGGGAPLTFDHTAIGNGSGVGLDTDITLTTIGNVTGTSALPGGVLLEAYNTRGNSIVSIGAATVLSGTNQLIMLGNEAWSAAAGKAAQLTLDGRIAASATTAPVTAGSSGWRVGVRNVALQQANTVTVLGGGAEIVNSASSGPASVLKNSLFGVYAASQQGNTRIDSNASIRITADANYQAGASEQFGAGLYAFSTDGSALINAGGTVIVDNRPFTDAAIQRVWGIGAEASDLAATINLSGTVEAYGLTTGGVRARNNGAGRAEVNAAAGSNVTTHGANSPGISGETDDGGTGDVVLQARRVSTEGDESAGVIGASAAGSVSIDASAGSVITRGARSHGLQASAATGATIAAGSVDATGADSTGVFAQSIAGPVSVTVASGANLSGGWSAVPGPDRAAGLAIGAVAGAPLLLDNRGSVGALSDEALRLTAPGASRIDNAGTITGFLTLDAGDDVINNAGTIVLRHWADTDGGGTRDSKRVASVLFGAGNDTVINTGTLSLANVANPGASITTGQYLPGLLGAAGYTTTTAGVEQAHLLQLERFEHRGTITLRDVDAGGAAPVAGDILLMSSGTVSALGVLTPGATPLVFVSDGGVLALDTELNQGGAQSHSDMLVVDSVALGLGGPTRVIVTNAGGLGAQTQGSGIKLVDVLGGDAASALNAFRLDGTVTAGAFTYNLFRSGPQSPDGDWYLRTEAVVTPDPPVGPPTTPPTPPNPPVTPLPTYRPEAALFSALPGFLRNVDASVPGTRAARLADEAGGLAIARRGRAWARYIRQDIDTTQQGTVAPSVTGDATGYQFGVELFGGKDEDAAQIGLYGGHVEANAAVRGISNGVANTLVGTLDPTITYAGVYVSRSRGRGLYFDAVLQYGWYGGEASTLADGEVAKIKGTGGYASLETGYGVAIVPSLVIEPQIQLVAQPQRVHDVTIVNARVTQDPSNTLAGRAGLRIKGDFGQAGWRLQPYVAASLWQGLDHRDRTRFSGNGVTQTTLQTLSELKAVEISGGLSLGVGSRFVGFAEYSRLSSRGEAGITREGNALSAGVRLAW